MLERGYQKELAVGTIASAGTLGILIPPSIMLVVMGDLLQVSVGALFAAARLPGPPALARFISLYIGAISWLRPDRSPRRYHRTSGPKSRREFWAMVGKSFLPPVFLVALVLGSIFGGWATPTEAAGVGAAGALLLAAVRAKLELADHARGDRAAPALTNAMVFFLFFGATLFSFVFRALGGDDIVGDLLKAAGIDTAWEILIFLHGARVLSRVLLRLDRDFPDRAADLRADPDGARFRRAPRRRPRRSCSSPGSSFCLSVNLQTSFLTPPFGFTLFCMRATVPPEVTMAHIYRGIVPFVLLQLIGLAITIGFPEFVLWLPRYVGLLN